MDKHGSPTATRRRPTAGSSTRAAPSETPELLAFDLLVRTAGELDQQVAQVLKPAEVTPAQYNVLRILRHAGEGGLPCGELSERLVRHDPDVTRLLDRLESRGFVQRSRESRDRRVVIARVTKEGRAVLEALGESIATLHSQQLGPLSPEEFRHFVALLHRVRSAAH